MGTTEEQYVEITVAFHDDAVEVQSVSAVGEDSRREDPELMFLTKGLDKKASFARNASAKIKQVGQELKKLASFSKKPTPPRRLERINSTAASALKGLKFISKTEGCAGWTVVENRFEEIVASSDGLLPRRQFGECIGMKECDEFAEQLFDALARRRNIQGDSIRKAELKEFWEQISNPSFDARIQTFFDLVDKDADGRITEQEVKEIIRLSASANKLSNIQQQAEEFAALIMEELDPDHLGYIMVDSLQMLLLEGPAQSVTVGESRNLSKMLSLKLKPTLDYNPARRCYKFTKYFFSDNWKRLWVMALWIAVMCGLFAYKYVQYRRRAAFVVMGHCVCMAKGAAETLKLNMALILFPVCRNTITWLRNKTMLGIAVPFDDNLNFHKVIAIAIAIGVGIHAISHLACDFPRLLHCGSNYGLMEPYFGKRPKNYWNFLKSVEGLTGIVMVVLMAIAFTLATPWFRREKLKLPKPLKKLTGFNAFWYSHHLFVIVYVLLVIHGFFIYLTKEWYKKTTWMYLAVPVTLYACERLTRTLRSTSKPVSIIKVAVHPGNVMALHMSRPNGFRYKSGQYMFVKCPAVSPFEWHPFSITSAPQDDYLSIHIRAVGDWTRQLRTVFSEACQQPQSGKSGLLTAGCTQGKTKSKLPRVRIDGPYGAPAQDYKQYEVVLLVGLGIGATPMISIVKDIVNNIKAKEEEEGNMGLENGKGSGSPRASKTRKDSFMTRRAYFYWVTREQGTFDWFRGIMNDVAEQDHNHVIELHNYCTSVYEEGDARSALIAMLQSLNHAKCGVDIVSGTRVKSHFAKPNWRSVYKRVALEHPSSRVGVFYCGPPALTKELNQLASDFSHRTTAKFDFHKENF